MSTHSIHGSAPFGEGTVDKIPAHWLMARLGKRVLRPGGLALTRWLIDHAKIDATTRLVELAPGTGITARELLSRGPASYLGVDRDAGASAFCQRALRESGFASARIVNGDASSVPAPDASADVVFGEAMLSMQPAQRKRAIMAEARRVLRAGGRYAIHELAVAPDDLDADHLAQIQGDLSRSIHVGVRIGTMTEWTSWLAEEGFVVEASEVAPMRLLELDRFVRDEGLLRMARFVFNVLRTPGASKRLREVRSVFRKHAAHLRAVAIVARAPEAD